MRILQLISGNLGQGGAERLVIDLSEAQANLGYDVTICSFRTPSQEVLNCLPTNVHFYTFGKSKGLTLVLPLQIAKYIRKEKFDVVNCHLPAVFLYILLALLICYKTKFVYTIHSNPEDEEPRAWVRWLRRIFIQSERLTFIGISSMISERFQNLYHLQHKVPMIENGRKQQTPSEQFKQVQQEVKSYCLDSKTRVFVAVGRLTYEKNHILMMQAFKQLQNYNIILLIIGNDYNGFLEIHENDIPDNAHFLGGKQNVYDYLCCADCFIMSSLYEGLPISILEAYSAGLPVVSTPVGGIPDIVTDRVNGFLSGESRLKSVKDGESRLTAVNEGENGLSVEEFVTAIQRYLDLDESTIQKMRETNRQLFADRFDIRQTAQQYLELYKFVMNG